jgi:osmotically-inducible protein OsmY
MKTKEQLQRDVQHELKWVPDLDEAGVGVGVHDGVVTLSGHVASYSERIAAERATKRVAGVNAIANDLVVKLPSSMERDDTDLAEAAVRALRWRSDVPADQIKVTVSNAWVTLEGELEWYYQKTAASQAVRNLTGVRGVTDLLRIKPHASALQVKDRIEEAFKRSAEIEAKHVSVAVQGGKVILNGMVRSWSERDEAESAAWSAPGVSEVETHLRVEEESALMLGG